MRARSRKSWGDSKEVRVSQEDASHVDTAESGLGSNSRSVRLLDDERVGFHADLTDTVGAGSLSAVLLLASDLALKLVHHLVVQHLAILLLSTSSGRRSSSGRGCLGSGRCRQMNERPKSDVSVLGARREQELGRVG